MKEFSYDGITINVNKGVFYPTDTSKIISEHLKTLNKNTINSALDLGCGSGIVALLMAKYGIAKDVYASDITWDAVVNTRQNAELLGYKIDARESSLFDAWKDMRFDLVVNDVSGISEVIAPLSPWFSNNVSCATGEDGTCLTMKIINDLPSILKPGGRFITPLLSLSRYEQALTAMRENFFEVKLVSEKNFYLPKEVMEHNETIEMLLDKGIISIKKKFGLYMWTLYLYEAIVKD